MNPSFESRVRRNRAVSEIYGVVLIISIVFFTVLLLVGFGTVVISGIVDETEENLTQDSLLEFNDRMNAITGSSVDARTVVHFPVFADETLSAQPQRGVINITVRATVDEEELVTTNETSTSTEVPLGTIRHTASDGTVVAYQGGAIIQRQHGNAQMLSPPSFDFDGKTIGVSMVDISSFEDVNPGNEMSARYSKLDSSVVSQNIEEMVTAYRYVGSNGVIHGIAPVEVEVTVETEFVEAWASYARNGMTESLEDRSVTADKDSVTMQFTVGEEITHEFNESPGQAKLLYAGYSQWAQVYETIDSLDQHNGSAFRLNESHTHVGTASNAHVAVYHNNSDGKHGWVYHRGTHDDWSVVDNKYEDEFEESDLAIEAIERPDGGGYVYQFEDDQRLCVFDSAGANSETIIKNSCEENALTAPNENPILQQIDEERDPVDVDISIVDIER